MREMKAKATGPLMVTFQLTAFAEEIECFEDEVTYVASQTEKHHRLQEQLGLEGEEADPLLPPMHFLPSGLMVEKGQKPLPKATFGGEIVGGGVLCNPVTGQKTVSLKVRTLGMIVDVVADAAIVNCRPKLHGFVCGHFWLSGRITQEIEATNRRLRIA
jgi:hypothetical protein